MQIHNPSTLLFSTKCHFTWPVMQLARSWHYTSIEKGFPIGISAFIGSRFLTSIVAPSLSAMGLAFNTISLAGKTPLTGLSYVVKLTLNYKCDFWATHLNTDELKGHLKNIGAYAIAIILTPWIGLYSPRLAAKFHKRLEITPTPPSLSPKSHHPISSWDHSTILEVTALVALVGIGIIISRPQLQAIAQWVNQELQEIYQTG